MHRDFVPLERALGRNVLLSDYLSGAGEARSFFQHPPTLAAAAAIAERIAAEPGRAPRAEVSAALVAQQERIGAGARAIENARRLADSPTVAVVTGQQPGLLTGPLFTIYKAISVVTLARRLAADTGRPVVPVFWVGSEDSDRAEVDHAVVLDRQGAPARITLPLGDEWTGRPVGQFPVAADEVFAALDVALPDSEFKPALFAALRDGEGTRWRTLGGWFAALMSRLFAADGLVMLDPLDPRIKALLKPVFRRAIEEPEWPGALVRAAYDRMRAAGYAPTLHPREDHTGFALADGSREPVLVTKDGFRAGEETLTKAALLALLDAHPERFLTTASLRVLAQDTLLPTVAYAAGPHELVYLGQLRGAYGAAELTAPVVLPRASATLVEGSQARLLADLRITPWDLHKKDEQGIAALVGRGMAEGHPEQGRGAGRASAGGLVEVFEEARKVVGEAAGRVAAASSAADPTLATPAAKLREKFDADLARLQEKALAARAQHDVAAVRRLRQTQAALFPNGAPQERSLCAVSFLARHPGPWHGASGLDLVSRLTEALEGTEGQHAVVRLG